MPTGRMLRLVLMFFGAVFGLLVLSFAFGSSSASADDGDSGSVGSTLGGVVSEATKPVKTVTHTVAPPAKPAAQHVANATKPVQDAVQTLAQSAPAASTLTPVAAAVDTTLTEIFAPVADLVDDTLADTGAVIGIANGDLVDATVSAAATVAFTPVLSVATAISGVARGALDLSATPFGGGDAGASGVTAAGAGLLATAVSAGFIVLLAMRRQMLHPVALPGSPVYPTDSSPG